MSDRLVEVEMKLAFLEKMMRELDGVVVELGRRVESMERRLKGLEEEKKPGAAREERDLPDDFT